MCARTPPTRVCMLCTCPLIPPLFLDLGRVKENYRQLFRLNKDMITEHEKKAINHQMLMDALKKANHMIQKSSNLRVGQAKTGLVTACRNAIRTKNIHQLLKLMASGTT